MLRQSNKKTKIQQGYNKNVKYLTEVGQFYWPKKGQKKWPLTIMCHLLSFRDDISPCAMSPGINRCIPFNINVRLSVSAG